MARAISASSQRDALGVEHANVHDVGLPSRVSTDSLLFPLPFPAGELISLRLTEQGLPVGTWDQKLFQEVSEAHAKSFEQLRPAQPVDAVEQAHTLPGQQKKLLLSEAKCGSSSRIEEGLLKVWLTPDL